MSPSPTSPRKRRGSQESLEGRTLGKYEVLHEIGRGSMGVVYLGHDPFAGREVAIKVAYPDSLQDKQTGKRYRKLFFNEAKVAGLLKHPNIVSVFDAGVEGEVCFLVMEYVPGKLTLQEHCRPEKLLTIDEAVWIIFNCAKALDYAHRKGVVHRDIKPRNILLTRDREVKLSDFGIALVTKLDVTDTQVIGAVGSPLYMSPEQISQKHVSAQSDIFSIGLVMYQLLTGKHPFIADSLPAIVNQITRAAHTPVQELRAEVPAVLGHIVDRTLKKEPEKRYRTAIDLAADLGLVFDDIQLSDTDLPDQDKFMLVKDLEFFRQFSENEIWEVLNAAVWQEFEPGAAIIQEGEVDSSFYIMVSGSVFVQKADKNVDTLRPGDCFGEMGFIAQQQRTATIVAKTGVTVMKVRATLMERASSNCQLRFHKVFLNTLIKRLSLATELISKTPI